MMVAYIPDVPQDIPEAIQMAITNYFADNAYPNVEPHILWGAMKDAVLGICIEEMTGTTSKKGIPLTKMPIESDIQDHELKH